MNLLVVMEAVTVYGEAGSGHPPGARGGDRLRPAKPWSRLKARDKTPSLHTDLLKI